MFTQLLTLLQKYILKFIFSLHVQYLFKIFGFALVLYYICAYYMSTTMIYVD